MGRNILYQPTFHTNWFVHAGVITYKWICGSVFFFNRNYVWCKYEINKITKFRSLKVYLFREMQKAKFCQKFVKFRKVSPKFRPTRNDEDLKLQSYVTSSISWLAPNIIVIEKKLIYRFICKWWPPCVRTSLL